MKDALNRLRELTVGKIQAIPQWPKSPFKDSAIAGEYSWEMIQHVPINVINKYDEDIKEAAKHRRDVSSKNSIARNEMKDMLIAFYRDVLGISNRYLFKKDGRLYAKYSAPLDDVRVPIAHVYNISPPTKIFIGTEGVNLGRSNTFSEWFTKSRNMAAVHLEKQKKHNKMLRAALEYCDKHGLPTESLLTTGAIIGTANEHAKEAYALDIEGEDIRVTHSDGDNCTWMVGSLRCECGNNRYYLEIDGDFLTGFHSYGQWN